MLGREAVPSHFPSFCSRESERKVNWGGGLKKENREQFLLEKNITLSMKKARFICREKGVWAVT